MAIDPTEDILQDDTNGASPGFVALMPDLGDVAVAENTAGLLVDQCVEGGWETTTQDGRILEVDTTFVYGVQLVFEDAEAAQKFLDREDISEVERTMIHTMREAASGKIELELNRDFLPESYPDGVVPDDTTTSLTPNTLWEMNDYVIPDFLAIMQSTYPDIGLVGASVMEDDINQLPGCYDGVPDNLAAKEAEQSDVSVKEVAQDSVAVTSSFGMK